jgi:4-aminobutyrate aminotransferase
VSHIIDRYHDVIAPVITFDTHVEVVRGEGSWLYDREGNRYLDFACGIAVCNLGHSHPRLLEAVHDQASRVWHAGGVFRYQSMVDAAEALRRVTPDPIDMFFYMNSGAEAVEASVKLARKTSGRQGIVVFRGGFHGRTMGSVTFTTSKAKYRQGYHPLLPSVFIAPFPHPFAWGMSQEEAVELSLNELARMFRHVVTPQEVAAFLVEPLQGEGGYYPAGKEFLDALRSYADEFGILLIMDEVQTGFGRTGDWFTSQVYDIRPDVLVLGKGIANGLPLSAVGASKALLEQWHPGSHGTTFGGNPISCAASAANIEALVDVIPNVPKLSQHAFDRWHELQRSHEIIGDVRGLGLMIGIDLVNPDGTPGTQVYRHVHDHAVEHGLFILPCGPDSNVIRFIPPLNVSLEDLDHGIDILAEAIASYRV